jgi:hypothetical protein
MLEVVLGLLMKGSWKLGTAMSGAGNSEMRGKLPRGTGRTIARVVMPDLVLSGRHGLYRVKIFC